MGELDYLKAQAAYDAAEPPDEIEPPEDWNEEEDGEFDIHDWIETVESQRADDEIARRKDEGLL